MFYIERGYPCIDYHAKLRADAERCSIDEGYERTRRTREPSGMVEAGRERSRGVDERG